MGKETQEAAEEYFLQEYSWNGKDSLPYKEEDVKLIKENFIAGAKWQAERSFTLEQIDELFFGDEEGYFDDFLDYRLGLTGSQGKNKITFKEWFEKFKKK